MCVSGMSRTFYPLTRCLAPLSFAPPGHYIRTESRQHRRSRIALQRLVFEQQGQPASQQSHAGEPFFAELEQLPPQNLRPVLLLQLQQCEMHEAAVSLA